MDFPELIRIFAANRVETVSHLPQYVALCRTHRDNPQFQQQLEDVRLAKSALEVLLDQPKTYALQIREALIKLNKNRGDPAFDLFYQLIVAGYKPQWSRPQQDYFEKCVKNIRTGHDFFLSFTTRAPEVL